MAGFPWACADCSFVPDGWKEDPRPCPNCGCLYFRMAEYVVKVKVTPFHRVIASAGPHSAAMAEGLTERDARWLRQMRIGWNQQ